MEDRDSLTPFRFTGEGGEYFKIWIVNVALTILTLGVYSAWAKVRRERYFYGNTWLGDHAFEYLASPTEILKGRAIVFAVLLASAAIAHYYPLAESVLGLLVLVATPWVVVKALQFRMRKSAFRNIRFNFDGTVWEAAKAYLWWPFWMPFTLGLLLPYVIYRQKRLRVANSRYGATPFSFHARPGDFYRVSGRFLVIAIGGGVLALLLGLAIPAVGAAVVSVPLAFFLYAYFQSRVQNVLFNHTRLGAHGFQSRLEAGPLFWIYLTNALGMALTLGLYAPWAQVRLARYRAERLALAGERDLDAFVADQVERVGSLGEEMSEAFDMDIGL
ncbi:YjgN family protein [Methylohalobius crimeensis]|uniref:YjgN family protein n=1 Tax=Methylohalobius crimeensis TaxID=244365 RepID=UPI0003B67B56|nr:YjgN family protein [Methylohalobius crimeensis]